MAKKKKTEKPPRQLTRRQKSHYQKQQRRQRILFISGVSIISVVILLVLLGWLLTDFIPMHRTVIEIEDIKINMKYYVDTLKAIGKDQSADEIGDLASNVIQQIEQSALILDATDKLGFEVEKSEIDDLLERIGFEKNEATTDLAKFQIIYGKLYSEYFPNRVPAADEQVNLMAMLLESEEQALEIRERLETTDNFSSLAEEYALNYYSKNINQGDFGWHNRTLFQERYLGSEVAIDYAFSAEPGTLSPPVYDEEADKQLGYWLIRINERPQENSANVSAVLLSSETQANEIKARLEAGEELGPIADEFSQYSLSKEKHGELGLQARPEEEGSTAISEAFDEYVFDDTVETGVWSYPVRDETYWTKGGYWLLKVIDKASDRELEEEDKNYLVEQAYSEWVNQLTIAAATYINHTALTPERIQWAIERVIEDMS